MVDEQGSSIAGNITRATLRAILESARSIQPSDESDEAKRKRLVSGYGDFNDIEFVAKIGIEEKRHAEDLDRLLRQLDLRGMAFFGEDIPLWFGEHPKWEIAGAIKKALDPQGRFPEL